MCRSVHEISKTPALLDQLDATIVIYR